MKSIALCLLLVVFISASETLRKHKHSKAHQMNLPESGEVEILNEPKPAILPVEEMPVGSAALVFMYSEKGVFERIGFESDSKVVEAEDKLLTDVLQRKYL